VLVAAGRQSNTAHLGLEKAGVKTGARGLVHVNEQSISPLLPAGIYTIPEVSMVGETEESLQKKGTAYIVGRANYRENARGRIIGDQDGFLKLLFRQGDLKLIGVHVMGELATEVVHLGLIGMMCDASVNLFVEACLNQPTLGALYKTAALDALQKHQKSKNNA
jgi:NAD(P) transhydrogenase